MFKYLILRVKAFTIILDDQLQNGNGRYLELSMDRSWNLESWEDRVEHAWSWYRVRKDIVWRSRYGI
jgi:hypothetical protein